MQILFSIVFDIVQLEKENMIPILNELGRDFNDDEIIKDIGLYNAELLNVFCYYNERGELLGYLRFSFDADKNIMVRSLQLVKGRNRGVVLKRLLYWAYTHLSNAAFSSVTKISSWVNNVNAVSIAFHEKMGFIWEKGNRDAGMFVITKADLINKMTKLKINQQFTETSHPGNYPIRVLQHNLLQTFQDHKAGQKEKMQNAITEGKIHPGITYHISDTFGMIYATPDTKRLVVHEQFLAYLWSFIYASFVIFEEGVQTKILNSRSNFWDGTIDNSRAIVKRAQELYLWSKSLPIESSPWPMNMPNPELFYSAEEQFYISKANTIYLKAATYLLNHEVAHLVNNHWSYLQELKAKNIWELTEGEKSQYIMIEREADIFAREEMVEQGDTQSNKLHTGISIVLAHCAALFALKHPSDIISDLHPDTDHRLEESINFLGLNEEKDIDYIYLIAAISCNLFLAFNKEAFALVGYTLQTPEEVSDPKSYFQACLNIIDEIKAVYINLDRTNT